MWISKIHKNRKAKTKNTSRHVRQIRLSESRIQRKWIRREWIQIGKKITHNKNKSELQVNSTKKNIQQPHTELNIQTQTELNMQPQTELNIQPQTELNIQPQTELNVQP